MPSISVIVPVYQAEKFLRDCVESVRRQTFSDWELLLVDDGCTDGSPALCDELARRMTASGCSTRSATAASARPGMWALTMSGGPISPFWTPTISTSPQCLETLWNLRERAGGGYRRLCAPEPVA